MHRWFRAAAVSVLALAATLTCSQPAAAQSAVPSLDLRGFAPPTDPNGGLHYEPASSPATGEFNTALWLSYAYRPVTLRGDDKSVLFNVIDHQLTGDFIANVGLAERLAIGVDVPFLLGQHGDDPNAPGNEVAFSTLGNYALSSHALGDMQVVVKGTLVKPTHGDSGAPNAGFALAVIERFGVPTGDPASFLGEGHITSETRVLADYDLIFAAVHASLGAKLRAGFEDFGCAAVDPAAICPTRFGDELPFGLAISVKPQAFGIDDDGHWQWFVETYGYVPLYPSAPFSNAALSEVQLGGGARYTFGNDLSVLAGADFALVSGIGTAPVRATISLGWAPRSHDADGDGVPDKLDQCPDLKEDHDGFEDGDGCPEIDNDNDGIPDTEDKCPNQPGRAADHGCPNPDWDGDGIPNEKDACPEVKGVPNANPKLNGCPDPDPDKDGVLGASDKCPNEPGRAADHGCPNPDWDGDGIPNAQDKCPEVKGVRFKDYPQYDGCPDTDGDGIPDALDKCPTVPGVKSDDPNKNGCPEEKLTPAEQRKRAAAKKKAEPQKKAQEAKKKALKAAQAAGNATKKAAKSPKVPAQP